MTLNDVISQTEQHISDSVIFVIWVSEKMPLNVIMCLFSIRSIIIIYVLISRV